MERVVKTLILFFFITISVFALNSSYLELVSSYDKKINSLASDEVLRVYHSLQNIYIKSIINGDVTLKKKTLVVLIKSAKILGLDYDNYEKELNTIKSFDKEIEVEKPKKKVKSKKIKSKVISPIEKSKNSSKTITSLYINNHQMIIRFSKNIDKSDIKTFALRGKKSYKKVFDIKARLSKHFKFKYPRSFKSVKIAQYNPSTVRVVLETIKPKKYKTELSKNRFIIYFDKKINKTKVTKPTSQNNYFIDSFNPKDKIIVLDPGHGGKDSGAVGYRRRYEKKAVLQIALKTAKELKKRGYRVYLTRSRDTFVKLRNRTNYANRKRADLFVSIHANAAPKKSKYLISKGIETFFLSRARSNRSKRVAALENKSDIEEMNYFSKKTFLDVLNREKIIQANKMALDVQQGMLKSLRKKYKVVDGGVREAPFWVLVGAQMPAILIEVGYITNPTESKRLFNFQYQNLLAKGIANGIDNYFLKNR